MWGLQLEPLSLRHASARVVTPPSEYHLQDRVRCRHLVAPVHELAAVVQNTIVVIHMYSSAATIAEKHMQRPRTTGGDQL